MNYESYNLLEASQRDFCPSLAIIVYESDEEESYYLESHDIEDGKLGAGVPLSMECISDIAKSFSAEHSITPHGKIPGNLLYADDRIGHQRYVWYNPPCKQHMFFHKKLNIPDGIYCIPGIIYEAKESGLNLYAFEGDTPTEKLFKAPFFNTTDGRVCLGTTRIEYPSNPSYQDIMKYWENKFWLTEFTHLGGTNNPTRNNLVTVTKQSKETFNYDELLPMTITLNHLLR